jgi:DNA end-binding protein Ku
MPPRANWKGYLRLSLVSCPIALYPASSLSEKVSFNRINRKTGNRLKQQNVDSETGEEVPREDVARGYEIGKGQYLIVEDDELEAVQVESTRTIEIDQFVPRNEIDDRYIDSPYYIAPDGLSRLLDRKKKSGLATVNRERRQSRRLPVSLTPPAEEAAIC